MREATSRRLVSKSEIIWGGHQHEYLAHVKVTGLSPITSAWFLSLIAGLGTGIGCLAVLLTRKLGEKTLDFSMGLASGVMLTVAFLNLIDKALDMNAGYYTVVLGFIIGSLSIMILDARIPHNFLLQGV